VKCDEYARDVLGSSKYSPWLKVYTAFNGVFKEGWIPDNYYSSVVMPALKGNFGQISTCKAMSRRIFETDLLPDLAYSVNRLLYSRSLELLDPTNLKNYLFDSCEKIVYKMDMGLQGKSVFIYDKNSFPESIVFSNGVFQKYIVQHPFFDMFSENAVSTIRITTVVDDELDIQCRAAYLRIPGIGETHVKSKTAIKVPIKINNGELHEKGYLPDWNPVICSPISKMKFICQTIPDFNKCVDICISLHKKMPFPRVIGWDLILNAEGNVEIMEWNGRHNGIRFSEATSGPCFADLGWQNLWKNSIAQ